MPHSDALKPPKTSPQMVSTISTVHLYPAALRKNVVRSAPSLRTE